MTNNSSPDDDDVRGGLETKPFLAHLEDLRWTIIRCVGALAVGVGICAFTAKYILEALYHPYRETGQDPKKLVNIGVVDPFSIHMEISRGDRRRGNNIMHSTKFPRPRHLRQVRSFRW